MRETKVLFSLTKHYMRFNRVIYNPVDDSVYSIPDMPANVNGLLWETNVFDKDVFVLYDDEIVYTYVFHRESLEGEGNSFVKLGVIKIVIRCN